MTSKHQKLFTIAILALSLFMASCRKDISVPDSSLDKLFGKWNWVQTSGGFTGQINTPALAGYTSTIYFKKTGICKSYENGKEQYKLKFSLSEGTSIYSTGTAYLIKYEQTGLFPKKATTIAESIRFGGQDSLYLSEEASGGYIYAYVKQ
jgi:hypothetical protein